MGMVAISLQSGSSGNCWFVESDGVRVLIDAGLSVRQVRRRLAVYGRAEVPIDAVFVSHEHADHIAGVAAYSKHFGAPIYITPKTWEALCRNRKGLEIATLTHFNPGAAICVKHLRIETIPTPHDSVDGSAFIVDDGQRRLGVMTDLGHVFEKLRSAMRTLDGVFIESNYDPRLLASGRYHPALKSRISGGHGHISNVESAELLQGAVAERLRWACLCHLSGENNSPELALATHREFIGDALMLSVDSRRSATGAFEV